MEDKEISPELSFFTCKTHEYDEDIGIWIESERTIDMDALILLYFYKWQIRDTKGNTTDCVKAELSNGEVFYPAYSIGWFRKLYYEWFALYKAAFPDVKVERE